MNGKLTYGVSLILGVLSLGLLIANMALIDTNRHQQESFAQRQAEINKGNSLAPVNQGIVQALAEAAISNNDTAAKDLLAAQGITIKPNATKAIPEAKSPTEKKK